jgi:hypothetical protein
MYNQLCARIELLKKKSNRIAIGSEFVPDPGVYGLSFALLSDGDVHFDIASLDDVSALSGLFSSIREVLRRNASVETFGCCSSFDECSDQRECLHPKEFCYLGCMYRQNLEAGRIFYGKNRNVD